jgi:hypothetical protein
MNQQSSRAVALVGMLALAGTVAVGGVLLAKRPAPDRIAAPSSTAGSTVAPEHGHGGTVDPAVLLPAPDAYSPGQTVLQKAKADALIKNSEALLELFPNRAAAEAKGFRTLGDATTGFEHFVRAEYLTDRADLDASRPEAVVFRAGLNNDAPIGFAFMTAPGVAIPTTVGPEAMWQTAPPNQSYGAMLTVWVKPSTCGPFGPTDGSKAC